MSRKKISTTIYVTPEQSEGLRLLHERTKVPVAVYIREGIDLVLRQYAHLLPGQLPLGQSLDGGSASSQRRPQPHDRDGQGITPERASRQETDSVVEAKAAAEHPERAAIGHKG
jgi:hypothetical protein